jgi:DNA-binding PadR family transcriptional regulator
MFYVLATLNEKPRHGYEIIKRTAELSYGNVQLATGTLYPAIERLVDKGLIRVSEHQDVPNRRYYELTDAGLKTLEAEVAAHKKAVRAAEPALKLRQRTA